MNRRIEPQGVKFLAVTRNKDHYFRFKTILTTSADKVSELIREITGVLTSIEITGTNIYPTSQWSRFVFHGIPTSVGNKNSVQLSTTITTEIQNITSRSLAQPARWLSRHDDISRRGSGTIIIILPGKVQSLGLTALHLFNKRCRIASAGPNYRTIQCYKCQTF